MEYRNGIQEWNMGTEYRNGIRGNLELDFKDGSGLLNYNDMFRAYGHRWCFEDQDAVTS
jgi:hypothetical protein